MLRINFTPAAAAELGLIERRNRGDSSRLADIQAALLRVTVELRTGRSWIWTIESEAYSGAYVVYEPPLKVHFRSIDDDTIGIVGIEEI